MKSLFDLLHKKKKKDLIEDLIQIYNENLELRSKIILLEYKLKLFENKEVLNEKNRN